MLPFVPPCGSSFRHILIFIFGWLFSLSAIANGCQVIPTDTAPAANKKHVAPRWLSDEPEGSAESPVQLEPKLGKRLELTIVPGQPCFLDFSLNLPSVMSLSIDAPSDIRSIAAELSTPYTVPKQRITGQQIAAGAGTFRFRYTLPAVSYQLKVVGTSLSESQRPARIVLVIGEINHAAPPLSLDAHKTEVVLDPLSRTAFRKFFLERHSLMRFSLSNVPAMGNYEREISINLRNASGDLALKVEGSDPSEKRKYAGYVLKPGHYFVEVDGSYNGSHSPLLQEPARSARIGLHIDSITTYAIPPSMVALSQWLKQAGLDELIEFNELTDFRRASRNLPGAFERYFSAASTVTATRAHQRICKAAPAHCKQVDTLPDTMKAPTAAEAKTLLWPTGSVEADRPALVVTFQVMKERDIVRATERAFYETHRVTLWNRLLQKISNLESVSTRNIIVEAPISCSAGLVYTDEDNTARRHGWECMSGSAFTPLGIVATINAATEDKLALSSQGLAKAVRPFLANFLNDKDAAFDFLTLDPEYIEVIIRGLRGRVVNGGRDWEKLQLTLSITGKNPGVLRASVDGQLASGMGSYPPDSQFTRDMDVQFKGNVTEFSKKLVTALRAYLEANP